jgi:hypothetical protein
MRDQTETNAAGSGAAAGRGPALVIVAEAPRPGNVLTGLCPPLRHGEAAALQTAWLKGIAQPLPGVAVWLFGRPAGCHSPEQSPPGLPLRVFAASKSRAGALLPVHRWCPLKALPAWIGPYS